MLGDIWHAIIFHFNSRFLQREQLDTALIQTISIQPIQQNISAC